jgi:hypothetical protein
VRAAGEWDPEAYRSRAGMSGTDEDWSEMGIDERDLQMIGFSGRVRANAASAQLAQERQTSYMYIMPQEHSSYRESQEVGPHPDALADQEDQSLDVMLHLWDHQAPC